MLDQFREWPIFDNFTFAKNNDETMICPPTNWNGGIGAQGDFCYYPPNIENVLSHTFFKKTRTGRLLEISFFALFGEVFEEVFG